MLRSALQIEARLKRSNTLVPIEVLTFEKAVLALRDHYDPRRFRIPKYTYAGALEPLRAPALLACSVMLIVFTLRANRRPLFVLNL
ncbi:hypothetical protein NDU88_000475 [Pleurodeles waltl]|uniref:Uncharacterized protein n=1 Tax=Pleurodeles waltl TaxID=8319 RepID=A0AAV7KM53_PLEWA|nr:hypothetical protein NDU88_000475 [Pleurodeles waltl]